MFPSTHSIQIAIKYANKLRKMALTDHLTAIGRKKLDEEEEGVVEDDDDFENMRSGNVIYSSIYSTLGNPGTPAPSSGPILCSSTGGSSLANDSCDVVFYDGTILEQLYISLVNENFIQDIISVSLENPLLTRQRAEISTMCSASPASYKNPFKKDGGSELKTASTDSNKLDVDSSKGLSLIDAWKTPVEKPTLELNTKQTKTRNSKKGAAKEKPEKSNKPEKNTTGKVTNPTNCIFTVVRLFKCVLFAKLQKQTTLFAMAGRKSTDQEKEQESSTSRNSVDDENSNISINFSEADSENVESLNVPVITEKKRKRSGHDEDNDVMDEAEKKSRISSKLSVFALKRSTVEDGLADV